MAKRVRSLIPIISLLTLSFCMFGAQAQQCPPRQDAATLGGPNDKFGWHIEPAGDLTGDGFDDLLVSADEDNANGSSVSNVRLVSGRTGEIVYTLYPQQFPTDFGFGRSRFTVIGDLTGDMIPEIVVGDPSDGFSSNPTPGEILVFSGADGSFFLEIEGSEVGQEFGDIVQNIGDLNNDGKPELAVSVPKLQANPTDLEGGFIVYNGADLSVLHIITAQAVNTFTSYDLSHLFPAQIAPAGDVNNDGHPDFMASDWLANKPGTSTSYYDGIVALFSGFDGSIITTVLGPEESEFGFDIAPAGDINGNGFDDFIVGAPDVDIGGLYSVGRAYVIEGQGLGTGSGLTVLYTLTGAQEHFADFGYSVDGGKDVNGDGVPDFVVGSTGEDVSPVYPNVGRVYVYSGATGAILFGPIAPNAQASNADYGNDVSLFGDANGDGFADLAVGARTLSKVEFIFLSGDIDNSGTPDSCEGDLFPPDPDPTPTPTPTPGGGAGGEGGSGAGTGGGAGPGSGSTGTTGSESADQYAEHYSLGKLALVPTLSLFSQASKRLPTKRNIQKATGSKQQKLKRKKKRIKKKRKEIVAGLEAALSQLVSVPLSVQNLTPGITAAFIQQTLDLIAVGSSKKTKKKEAKTAWSDAEGFVQQMVAS